jgi:N-methylhydantoinase B
MFVWDFLHLSDVGGATPGSIAASNSEVFQEGVRIPPVKLYRAGVLDEAIVSILKANTRTPDLNWGDINALVAALNQGERRVQEMVAKYGVPAVRQSMSDLLEYSQQRAQSLIATIPDGQYGFEDYLEMQQDDGAVRIEVTVTISGSSIHLDFTGTDPQVALAYNFLAGGGRHGEAIYGVANLLRTMDPTIPANAGLLRPITAHMPAGTILNPRGYPALGVRMATLRRVMETVHGALAKAMPTLMPAGSGDQTLVFLATGDSEQTGTVSLLQPSLGGSGARATKDGIDGLDAISWLRNVPTEALEISLPIVVTRYRLDEAHGAGRYRGGRGSVFEFEATAACHVVARNRNRRRLRPWGRDGGHPGGVSSVHLNPDTPAATSFESVGVIPLAAGDTLRFVSSSGGGFGSPLQREPRLVLRDILDGAVTAEVAREVYAVVVVDGLVDERATQELREGLAKRQRPVAEPFSFGPERDTGFGRGGLTRAERIDPARQAPTRRVAEATTRQARPAS